MRKGIEDISAHNFPKSLNTHGGSSFRHWTMLLKHKGVFVGFDNHEWVEFASSEPSEGWLRGCQDSGAHGSPMPRPQGGHARLIRVGRLPDEIRHIAETWVQEAIAIINEGIERDKVQKAREDREAVDEMRRTHDALVDAWTPTEEVSHV